MNEPYESAGGLVECRKAFMEGDRWHSPANTRFRQWNGRKEGYGLLLDGCLTLDSEEVWLLALGREIYCL